MEKPPDEGTRKWGGSLMNRRKKGEGEAGQVGVASSWKRKRGCIVLSEGIAPSEGNRREKERKNSTALILLLRKSRWGGNRPEREEFSKGENAMNTKRGEITGSSSAF